MIGAREISVLVHDPDGAKAVPADVHARTFYDPDATQLEVETYLFILTSATHLPEVAQVVRNANKSHHLRALFVRDDSDADWLPQMLGRANLRSLRNIVVHSGPELPRRIIRAWQFGAEDQLIARATVIHDRLLVQDCALKAFEVPFESMPALESIPEEERGSFEIAVDGSYLHWPASDIHLDLDAIRGATEPEWQKRATVARMAHNERFGKAVAAVRTAHGLRQSDVEGLSERQVRRIEGGTRPTVKSLELIARAHELDLDGYLNEVAHLA